MRAGWFRYLVVVPARNVAQDHQAGILVRINPAHGARLPDLTRRLRRRRPSWRTRHDLRVALQVCDRIAVMKQGEVVEVAPTAEIFFNPQHSYTKALFAAVPGGSWQDRKAS
jgi:peptide/nickel transport system ATP-binding protein